MSSVADLRRSSALSGYDTVDLMDEVMARCVEQERRSRSSAAQLRARQFELAREDVEAARLRWVDATAPPESPPDVIARLFHEEYERLAPSFGYETREESRVPWPEVPQNNRDLMAAVVATLREKGVL